MNNLRSFIPRQRRQPRNFPDLSCGHAAVHIFDSNTGDIDFAADYMAGKISVRRTRDITRAPLASIIVGQPRRS